PHRHLHPFPTRRSSDLLLKKLSINKDILETKLDELLKSFPRVSGQAYLSSATNNVLQQAEKETREFKDEYISIEHLLLALQASRDRKSTRLNSSHVKIS